MSNKVKPRDFSIYLILLSVIFFILTDATFKLYQVKYDRKIFIFIIVLSITFMYLAYRKKYMYFSLLLLLMLPEPFYIIKNFRNIYLKLHGFILSLITNQYITEEYQGVFIVIMLVGINFIIAAFFYLTVIKKHTLPLLVFGSAIFIIYYYLGSNLLFKNLSVFLSFSLILYSYNQYMLMRESTGFSEVEVRSNFFKRLMSFSVILVILVSFITRILPYDFKPVNYEWVDKNIMSRFENIKGRGDSNLSQTALKTGFNLSYTGYQPNPKKLGGPIKLNNSIALKVVSDEREKEIHLRGSIKEFYNGELWSKSNNTTQRYDDKIDIKYEGSSYSEKEIKVRHIGVQTSTIFNILYPSVVSNTQKYVFADNELEIFNPRVVKNDTEYKVIYKDFNITRENNEKLKSSKEINDTDKFKNYLQLPNISERVINLTQEITKKYNTPYEKASAIEAYLRENYKYDRDTSNLPEGREFVDYFLFEEKKGYCTYYATSMAVMCRTLNIPARYVEGFSVKPSDADSSEINVLNSDAHSWVELYFDWAGWVAFDPTPGHESPSLKLNEVPSNTGNVTSPNNGQNNSENKPQNQQKPNNEAKEPAGDVDKEEEGNNFKFLIYLSPLPIIIGLLVLIYYIRNKLNNRGKFLAKAIRVIKDFGEDSGVSIGSGETIREYIRRLSIELKISNVDETIDVFEETLYGRRLLSDQDMTVIREFIKEVKKAAMERVGKVRFYAKDFLIMFKSLKVINIDIKVKK